MAPTQYVALLRGINVGGRNVIRMADLRACLEERGFANVATYIQSGNVLLEAGDGDLAGLTGRIAGALTDAFGYEAPIVVRSHAELRAVVDEAPGWMGEEPEAHRYDCLFLKEPLEAGEAMASITLKEGVDRAATGPRVLYFSRLASKAAQSHLTRIVSLPVYQRMTIRNWNTTTKLLALMDARAGG